MITMPTQTSGMHPLPLDLATFNKQRVEMALNYLKDRYGNVDWSKYIKKPGRQRVAKTYEFDVAKQWMRDWLGNEIVVGDTIIMPARQGSSGAEHIVYRVEEFIPGNNTYYGSEGGIKAKAIASSRYKSSGSTRSVRLYILSNVTKVNVERVDL